MVMFVHFFYRDDFKAQWYQIKAGAAQQQREPRGAGDEAVPR